MSFLSDVVKATDLARKAVAFAIDLVGAQGAQDLLTEESAKRVNEEADSLEKDRFPNG